MRTVRSLALLLLLIGCGSDGTGEVDTGGERADAGKSSAAVDAEKPAASDAGKQPVKPDAGAPATFSEIYESLFPTTTNARCNFCHSMPAKDASNGKLSMGETKAAAYDALLGKISTSTRCTDMPLLTPGDPDASLFLLKFSETPPCGGRMPLGGKLLTSTQVARIRSWIVAGAKND
ncbi:MAG: hypothetical protein RLZZ450_7196 [Pseudomonadota bacterium]|jgi:hypothetical protein